MVIQKLQLERGQKEPTVGVEEVVRGAEFSGRQVAFNKFYEHLGIEQLDKMRMIIAARSLFDLGCGKDGWRMAELSWILGAKNYTGIDFWSEATEIAQFRTENDASKKNAYSWIQL